MKSLLGIGTALILALGLAGCSDSAKDTQADKGTETVTTPTPTSDPQTQEAATAAAKEASARFGAGDYAGYWDLYDAATRKAISREEYVMFAKQCDIGGITTDVANVRLESPTLAIVRFELGGQGVARNFVYEEGAWHQQPDSTTVSRVKSGTC